MSNNYNSKKTDEFLLFFGSLQKPLKIAAFALPFIAIFLFWIASNSSNNNAAYKTGIFSENPMMDLTLLITSMWVGSIFCLFVFNRYKKAHGY